jgi:hypothetical protein
MGCRGASPIGLAAGFNAAAARTGRLPARRTVGRVRAARPLSGTGSFRGRRVRRAEVKTEGDSFFVVFPSASDAVRCALNILATADAATRERPAAPLWVGIGVHAG